MPFILGAVVVVTAIAAPALGAAATFTATGPTTVPPGTVVAFQVTLSAQVLPWFNSADVIIGSNDAPFDFSYSDQWYSAMANVVAPTAAGVYPYDVRVGGENPEPVGSSLVLGTVTVDTAGLPDGGHQVIISSDDDNGYSALRMEGLGEPVYGTGVFTVDREACELAGNFDGDCDVDLLDYHELGVCFAGPGSGVQTGCEPVDLNFNGDVDLADFGAFQNSFTGARDP